MPNSLKRVTSSSNQNPTFDEQKWVINIRTTMEDELESDDHGNPVSIFNVPKTLLFSDPDSYTPQEISLGPYHYWRPELYDMERYKLAAAKRICQKLYLQNNKNVKFQNLVDDQLIKIMPKIRSCYHKFLSFSNETLAWMFAIDACFMLQFLHAYGVKEGVTEFDRVSSSMSHFIDYAGSTKSAHNAILKDMVMLENQIPLFVLRKMLQFQFATLESSDEVLTCMLIGLYNELSPFKFVEEFPKIKVSESNHLLDYLYQILVPKIEKSSEDQIEEEEDDDKREGKEKSNEDYSSYSVKFVSALWEILSKLNKGPIRLIKKVLLSKPLKLVFKLPWTIISKLPGFAILKMPVEYMIFNSSSQDQNSDEKQEDGNNDANKPPLIEEITIPSVSELVKSGVKFSATTGNISTINFDTKYFTLYIPSVSLDVNTEVVLRNLVAYETSIGSGPLVLTRYTEFMNGIIDTEEDVKILRERGILLNRLKSDKEAADLWNGMSKSIKLSKVLFLDKTIEDVNRFYNGRWRVKLERYAKIYVYGSWQFLTVLACVMFLLLMALQAFCSVYSCSRIFRFKSD